MEHVLLDTMYELPSIENLEKVVVDENAITKQGKPILIFKAGEEKVRVNSGRE